MTTSSDRPLQGKSAIVTGSTSGIGLGIARAFAGAGANVMLNGFGDAKQIETLRAGIAAEFKVVAGFSGADISQPSKIREMVSEAVKQFGAVDILVNNAGIQHTAPVEDFPDEKWDAIIAINLSSNFHAIKAVLPQMRQRNWGRIINVASTHGLVASTQKSAYVAAKHGVLGLTKVVALETATTGITCNAICPGWVLTPLVQKQIDDIAAREGISNADARARLLGEKQPSLQFATPEQIAALALFLSTEHAAQVRGAALPVDGGWLAQ
jgi:3-hydroxybutyrate dehydrogenase